MRKAIDILKKEKKEKKKSNDIMQIPGSYQEFLNSPFLKGYIFTLKKDSRESINPNYRYCVLNDNVDECYLTDDIGVAMEFAAKKSNDGNNWSVCRITKASDGSYITIIEGHCMNGHYIESIRTFLHFDYISQRAEVKKISNT